LDVFLMQLIAGIRLLPNREQDAALHDAMATINAACALISAEAWRTRTFARFDLHHLMYYRVRESLSLGASATQGAIAKVANAYKLDRARRRRFRPDGAVTYTERMLSFDLPNRTVSIWTKQGRMTIPFACDEQAVERLSGKRGEAKLIWRSGKWLLHIPCEVACDAVRDPAGFLGVDLGLVNIAADSDGEEYSGSLVLGLRRRHRRLRRKLQRKGTRSAKRLLRKRSRKEGRFARDVNHVISKRIVAKAKDTGRGIALENLEGIRERVTARRSQRATLHSWSFHQLRGFIEYKAMRSGVAVVTVDPRNTSRTCPECEHVDALNRKERGAFLCVGCGFAGPADTIAAINIGRRAAFDRPNVPAGGSS